MRSESILLFSSLSFDADLMARLLDANDARVVRAADTGSALKAVQRESLSLAILDCGMSEMEWRPLRGVLEKRGVPVLLVEPPPGAMKPGTSAPSIARPIDTGDFPRRVKRALRGSTAGRRGSPGPGSSFSGTAGMSSASFVFAMLLLVSGCASDPAVPPEGGAVMTRTYPEAMRTRGWMEFTDLKFHSFAEGGEPKGPHIFGSMMGLLFTPESDVVGATDEPPKGLVVRKGFMELRSRRLFREGDTGGAPPPPYVPGFIVTEEGGGFYPSGSVVSVTAAMAQSADLP